MWLCCRPQSLQRDCATDHIPGCDEEHTPQLTIVAVLGFLQEFSSTALTKHFKTGLNQKKRAGICWNKPRNIKYFQISGAISLERLGTTTQPHARALVLSSTEEL